MVSVIIPYYNKKDTIDRAVDSVISQSYTDWEVIIVDDCSVEPLSWKRYAISITKTY
jgi:glycosyltransferase involved in cell wall biosynthesis